MFTGSPHRVLGAELLDSFIPEVTKIDAEVVARAKRRDLPLAFFESWRYQAGKLNALGLEDGLFVLMQVVDDPELAKETLAEWFSAYRAGDIDRLEQLTLTDAMQAQRPRYYDEIVFGRSEAWLPMIQDQLYNGGAFVAIGFMHLIGDRGLVQMLRDRGYTVTWVTE